jgi:anti-sigma regulatory factor (Ser/Thr protein kinase)
MLDLQFNIEGGNFSKAGFASSEIKKVLKQLNINPQIIKCIVVALYEAEVNVVAHAYSGTMYVTIDSEKIVTKIIDVGPGIPDISLAMQKGFSTASDKVREMGFGAGMGLPNIKKNSDKLDISSEVGKGTTLEITKFISNG